VWFFSFTRSIYDFRLLSGIAVWFCGSAQFVASAETFSFTMLCSHSTFSLAIAVCLLP
jgi:hypothetical protein